MPVVSVRGAGVKADSPRSGSAQPSLDVGEHTRILKCDCPEIDVGPWLGARAVTGRQALLDAPPGRPRAVFGGTPGVGREALFFWAEAGRTSVVVFKSMCNRCVDCVGADWTSIPVRRCHPRSQKYGRSSTASQVEEVAHGADDPRQPVRQKTKFVVPFLQEHPT